MSYADASWAVRSQSLGDKAESQLLKVFPNKIERYGLERAEINLKNVPAKIRNSPDYLSARGFIEAIGFGRDQTAKVRVEKIKSLIRWQGEFDVDLFFWDSHKKRYTFCGLDDYLTSAVPASEVRVFPEGAKFFATPAEAIPSEWVKA